MEFLNFDDPTAVAEYNNFMERSSLGNFMQSIEWGKMKQEYGWRYEAILSRNFDGTLVGTVLVLIKKFPFPMKSFLCSLGPGMRSEKRKSIAGSALRRLEAGKKIQGMAF